MESHSQFERLVIELNHMRDTLNQLSLMLKDYQANLDIQGEGHALQSAIEVLASARQGIFTDSHQKPSRGDSC